MSKTRRLNARVCSDRCRVAYWRERKRDVALRAIGAYQ
jgi:predicted nucleic acid-binding Zn ribbon protein